MSFEAQLTGQYADVRARLMGRVKPMPRPVLLSLPTPKLEPVEEKPAKAPRAPRRPYVVLPRDLNAPLNMLTPPSWRFLVAVASARHGIPQADIVSASRVRSVVAARQDAMAMVYQHTQASTSVVGRYFGRDHTTVIHALQKMKTRGKLVELTPAISAEQRCRPLRPLVGFSGDEHERRAQIARLVVRQGFAIGRPIKNIAEELGFAPRSVMAIASGMGLVHPGTSQEAYHG